jgi:hypothetical protein
MAEELQQTSSSNRAVKTQLAGGMDLTLRNQNWNMEGDDWDNKSIQCDKMMKSTTRLANERNSSVNMKPKQLIMFPTTPCMPSAGPNWHYQSDNQSNHGQTEKIEDLIRKVYNINQLQ